MITQTLTLPIVEQVETRAQKIQSQGIPKSLSSRDRLRTNLLSSRPALIVYTSIFSNEECLLKRYDEFEEICETIQRTKCNSG